MCAAPRRTEANPGCVPRSSMSPMMAGGARAVVVLRFWLLPAPPFLFCFLSFAASSPSAAGNEYSGVLALAVARGDVLLLSPLDAAVVAERFAPMMHNNSELAPER